jgi:hypothetical protein
MDGQYVYNNLKKCLVIHFVNYSGTPPTEVGGFLQRRVRFLSTVEMKENRYYSKVSLRGCLWADFCGFIPDIGSCPEVGIKKDNIHYIYYSLRSIPIFSS